jgi:hypothetical protein
MQDALSWARQSHFSAEMLASLRDLNHRFLDLMAAQAGCARRVDLKLPAELTQRLKPLSAAQREAAANCPYALFDLRLDDHAHWLARLGADAHWRVADEPARQKEPTVEEDTAGFVRLALFYAWHVASTPNAAAHLLLGMTEPTAAAFRSVTLNRLPALGASEAVNLSARWCASGFYWSALLRAAASTDGAHLRKVQLFGVQLAAAALLP